MCTASWRIPFGQSGVLQFFLQLIATPDMDKDLLFHSLRLIGNSCADTGILSALVAMAF